MSSSNTLKHSAMDMLSEHIRSMPETIQEQLISTTISSIRKEEEQKYIKILEHLPSLMRDIFMISRDGNGNIDDLKLNLYEKTMNSKLNIAIVEGVKMISEHLQYNENRSFERPYRFTDVYYDSDE